MLSRFVFALLCCIYSLTGVSAPSPSGAGVVFNSPIYQNPTSFGNHTAYQGNLIGILVHRMTPMININFGFAL